MASAHRTALTATGTLTGLRSDVTPAQLARAAVEGVVCNLLGGGGCARLGRREGRVFLIGGAAQSAAYRRMVADLTGRPVLVPSEASSWRRAPPSKLPRCISVATSRR